MYFCEKSVFEPKSLEISAEDNTQLLLKDLVSTPYLQTPLDQLAIRSGKAQVGHLVLVSAQGSIQIWFLSSVFVN